MLHILLFILKLIGILLLIILGLIGLTICIVLFIPLRYHVSGSCKGKPETLDACIQFSVFFRLVRGKVVYTDQNLVWELYVAWKRLFGSEPVDSQLTVEEAERPDFDKPVVEMTEMKEEETAAEQPKTEEPKEKQTEKENFREKQTSEEKTSAGQKIAGIFEKIKCTIQKICDKMKLLYGKAEIVQQFLTNEVHQDAFRRVVKGGKTLLYKLRPKKAGGEVVFGFSDPAWTGKLLAVCSMLHPYLGQAVLFYPDFQEKKLEGSLYIKGSLRMLPAAVFAVRLLLAKSIRTTIHDIRNFHF